MTSYNCPHCGRMVCGCQWPDSPCTCKANACLEILACGECRDRFASNEELHMHLVDTGHGSPAEERYPA